MRRLFTVCVQLGLTALGGGCSGPPVSESAATQAVTGSGFGSNRGGSNCDLTPLDDAGTLPGCAAGSSTLDGPGVPADFTGQIEATMPIGPEAAAAAAAADALNAARNPEGQSPLERGFGAATESDARGR